MRICFLIPPPLASPTPAERIFGCNYGIYTQPNIFILYPATILQAAGHHVQVVDFPIERSGRSEFERFAREHDLDVIVFYTVFLSKETDLRSRDMLRKGNSSTRYVYLATEPTATPGDFVGADTVVVRGEPESRIVDVIDAFGGSRTLDGIPGISYMTDDGPVHRGGTEVIADLDSLPFPDRSLLPPGDYHNPKLTRTPFTTMIASRGCSFGCYYCVPNSQSFAREIEFKREAGCQTRKPPVRLRSAQNVIAEFSGLAAAGYRAISFLDDQFVWGRERTIEICDGIAGCGVEWSCLARADMLQDADVVQAMGRGGCRFVAIGLESFNQDILDYIGKGLRVEMIYSAVDNLRRARVEAEINILIGSCPLETRDTIEETFREVVKLDVDYAYFSVCTPFPYTLFNAMAKKEGWMIKPEYEAIDPMRESFVSYPHLYKAELDLIIRSLYRRYYFRPAYAWKRIRRLRGPRDLLNKVRAALSIAR